MSEFVYDKMTPELQRWLDLLAEYTPLSKQVDQMRKAWVQATDSPESKNPWNYDLESLEVLGLEAAAYVQAKRKCDASIAEREDLFRGNRDQINAYKLADTVWLCRSGTRMPFTVDHDTPSGRYWLSILTFKPPNDGWAVTECSVYRAGEMSPPIAVVCRNYPQFPFLFVEDHPDGHDYLVCGADYMGQTVIRLDTGERKDYMPDGESFCWRHYEASPSKRTLAVDGCFWTCPDFLYMVDFSRPMEALDVLFEVTEEVTESKWTGPDTCEYTVTRTWAVPFDCPLDDCSDEQQKELLERQKAGESGMYRDEEGVIRTWSRDADR